MYVHLSGVTAAGGIPIFSRSLGCDSSSGQPPSSIPFATLASLNGVNWFARLNEANLLATQTQDTQIHWKVFDNTIVLIIIFMSLENVSQDVVKNTLDNIYSALVLFCSSRVLKLAADKSSEELKKCIKVSLVVVDYFLRMLLTPSMHPNVKMSLVNTLLVDPTTKDFVKQLTESYCTVTSSDLTAFIVNGFIVSVSKGWSSRLSQSRDSFLVVTLVNAMSSSISNDSSKTREVSIFLPENCPNDETRLIVTELYPTVFLVVLCGSDPSLESIVELVTPLTQSQTHVDIFKSMHSMRGCSTILPIDDRITSFALIRRDRRTLLKYGNFDNIKMKELLSAIDFMMSEDETDQQFLKFKGSTAFKVTSNNVSLIIFISNEFSFKIIQNIAHKTMKQLSDKKF